MAVGEPESHLGRDTRIGGRGLVFPHPAAWSISRPEAIIDCHIWRREHERKFNFSHFHVRHRIILTPSTPCNLTKRPFFTSVGTCWCLHCLVLAFISTLWRAGTSWRAAERQESPYVQSLLLAPVHFFLQHPAHTVGLTRWYLEQIFFWVE